MTQPDLDDGADRAEIGRRILEHRGPWTEEAFLALGVADPRVDLLDGSIVLAPADGGRRARTARRLRAAVAAVLPDRLAVGGPVHLRVAPGRVLVPDVVVHAAGASGQGWSSGVHGPGEVLLVVEVVGRGHGLVDRHVKPQLYADSGIPYYLRVDQDAPAATACMLVGGRHLEYAAAAPGEPLVLGEPFGVELDLDALTAEDAATLSG